jgi:hypothetical protein
MDQLLPELEARGLIDDRPVPHPGVRLFTGDVRHIRYLKVSEGCDHGCAFCAIPLMRGKHRSFALDEVVREAQLLEAQGAREVNLVAQDLAHYGRDRRDGFSLPELLEALVREDGDSVDAHALPVQLGDHAAPARGHGARASHPAIPRHADAACVGRRARAHAPSGAPTHDPRSRAHDPRRGARHRHPHDVHRRLSRGDR